MVAEAVEGGADYVEVDVRHHDGRLLLSHDPLGPDTAAGRDEYQGALPLLAQGKVGLHLDLKDPHIAGNDWEVRAVARALEHLPVDDVAVTSEDEGTVRAVRRWAVQEGVGGLLVGLSVSQERLSPAADTPRGARVETQSRLEGCDANLAVVQHGLARQWVEEGAPPLGVPLLVWTVDRDSDIQWWLSSERAWMLTSNYPGRALELRRVHSET